MKNSTLATRLAMAAVFLAVIIYFGFSAASYFTDPYTATLAYSFYNTKDELFQNANIRKAFTLAMDRVELNEMCFSGSNIPTYGTAAVGQFAIALLLEICHHAAHHSDTVHAGKWAACADWCYWDYPLIELDGKTMGIIGFGRIGQQTGRIARALGMRVLACGSHPSDSGRAIADYVELDALLAASDVIALHCPLFPETEGIINRETIRKMKDGVILLNNSRGPLVVEQDLADALNSGKVYAAGLDVVSTEPIREDNPLLTAKNCIITPHISWAPRESRQRIMDCAVSNVKAYLDGKPVNVVNLK